jgi:DNA-binding transcriptional LysR family regulator
MTKPPNRLDLNLLRVFDAIMGERSVLRAAQKICLSQSAVSHALARLRDTIGDELFIRTPAGMQPTVRALAMAPLIREAWVSLEKAIEPAKFDPRCSARRFTIAASDFTTLVMVPHLLSLLRSEAPFVELAVRPDSRIDLTEQIDLGQVDAAIGSFSDAPQRFRSRSLFHYDDVLIAGSPPTFDQLSLEKLSELPIAIVSSFDDDEVMADGFVAQRGLVRRSAIYDRTALERACSVCERRPRLAVSLQHFLALPSLLEASDLAAIVPRPLARLLVRTSSLSLHELPYRSSNVDVSMLWHERNSADAAHKWLREMLRRAAEQLESESVERQSSTPACTTARLSVVDSSREKVDARIGTAMSRTAAGGVRAETRRLRALGS